MSRKPHLVALRASLFYVIVAGLWILYSDQLVAELVRDRERLTRLEIYKGWAFVAFTGVMFFSSCGNCSRAKIKKSGSWSRPKR